jgi:hypothetical protein
MASPLAAGCRAAQGLYILQVLHHSDDPLAAWADGYQVDTCIPTKASVVSAILLAFSHVSLPWCPGVFGPQDFGWQSLSFHGTKQNPFGKANEGLIDIPNYQLGAMVEFDNTARSARKTGSHRVLRKRPLSFASVLCMRLVAAPLGCSLPCLPARVATMQ